MLHTVVLIPSRSERPVGSVGVPAPANEAAPYFSNVVVSHEVIT